MTGGLEPVSSKAVKGCFEKTFSFLSAGRTKVIIERRDTIMCLAWCINLDQNQSSSCQSESAYVPFNQRTQGLRWTIQMGDQEIPAAPYIE